MWTTFLKQIIRNNSINFNCHVFKINTTIGIQDLKINGQHTCCAHLIPRLREVWNNFRGCFIRSSRVNCKLNLPLTNITSNIFRSDGCRIVSISEWSIWFGSILPNNRVKILCYRHLIAICRHNTYADRAKIFSLNNHLNLRLIIR